MSHHPFVVGNHTNMIANFSSVYRVQNGTSCNTCSFSQRSIHAGFEFYRSRRSERNTTGLGLQGGVMLSIRHQMHQPPFSESWPFVRLCEQLDNARNASRWKQCRAYGSDRRRWLPYPEPLVGWRAPLTGAYPITPQSRLGVRVGNQRFQIPRAYLDAIG